VVPELILDEVDEPMQILEDILGLEGDKVRDYDQSVKFLLDLEEENRENTIEPLARAFASSSSSNNLQVNPARRVSTASIMSYPELDDDDLDSLLSGIECSSPVASPASPVYVAIQPRPLTLQPFTPPQSPISVASTSSGERKKSTRGRKRKVVDDDTDYEFVSKSRKQTSNKKAAQSYRARKKNADQDVMEQLEGVTSKNLVIRKRLEDALNKRNLMLEIICGVSHHLDRMPEWVKIWYAQKMAQTD